MLERSINGNTGWNTADGNRETGVSVVQERMSRKSGRVRRKTCRELTGRTRRAAGKGHGEPSVIIERERERIFQTEVTQIDVQDLKGCHTNYESCFLSK